MATKPSKRWVLDRTINLTDAGALVVSFVALGLSLFNLWFLLARGPQLMSFPPPQVLFLAEYYPALDQRIARFAASRQFINDRRLGAGAIVTNELLLVGIGEAEYKYVWQAVGDFNYEGDRVWLAEGKAPKATLIKAGEAVGQETYYAPATVPPSSLEWSVFLAAIQEAGEIHFRFVTSVHAEPDLSYSCRVRVTPELLRMLNTRAWAAPACQSLEAET